MHIPVELILEDVTPSDVFPHLATLDRYPSWMRLVHRVDPVEPDEGRPAWWVELRARVGPFTRSKQLRMVRTAHEPDHRVRYERVQFDERDHAAWVMTASTDAVDTGTRVFVELEYGGSLWTGGLLERVLEEEVRRGRESLRQLVSGEPRH
jgi:Polyketide cyclase / dehydrase and lipid transport